MAHFYLDEQLIAPAVGSEFVLVGEEARHAVVVSRLRPGESVRVGDGAGLMATGTVVTAEPRRLVVEVTAVARVDQNSPAIWLAQALAKGGRDELAVQVATELGVDGVIAWASERSVVRWDGPKVAKGHDRWKSVVREATKQSVRAWLPEVEHVASTNRLAERAERDHLLVLDPTGPDALSDFVSDGRNIVVVVGPEGGIAPHELDRFRSAGADLVRLGDSVLRTSSAGPAAIAVINTRLGRW